MRRRDGCVNPAGRHSAAVFHGTFTAGSRHRCDLMGRRHLLEHLPTHLYLEEFS